MRDMGEWSKRSKRRDTGEEMISAVVQWTLCSVKCAGLCWVLSSITSERKKPWQLSISLVTSSLNKTMLCITMSTERVHCVDPRMHGYCSICCGIEHSLSVGGSWISLFTTPHNVIFSSRTWSCNNIPIESQAELGMGNFHKKIMVVDRIPLKFKFLIIHKWILQGI